jgi:mRNA interferase HigB
MRLIAKSILHTFKEKYADARSFLGVWEAEIEEAQWNTPHDLKGQYPRASLLGNQRVVFDICGNKYRILTKVNYRNKIVVVEKVGTHKEYDKWDLSK